MSENVQKFMSERAVLGVFRHSFLLHFSAKSDMMSIQILPVLSRMKPADSNPYTIKTRRIKGEPDMQDTLESKLELFNSFSQPVILVREGKVVYANHAAAACGIDAAQDAGEFVGG